jgi:hypothetical protein
MALLGLNSRRSFSARAARFFRNEEAEWTTGDWIRDPLTGETFEYNEGKSTLGSVREFLQARSLGARNRKCIVCAEGALLLAFAEDKSLVDDLVIGDLLREFQPDALNAARASGYLEEDEGFDGIAELNDENLNNPEDVTRLLEKMAGTI